MQDSYSVLEDMTAVSRKLRLAFELLLRGRRLTAARARILLKLIACGAAGSQTALAEQLQIKDATLGRVLDDLEDAGAIARIAVRGDRRAKGILLTEQGRRQAGSLGELVGKFGVDVLRGIDQTDLTTAHSVIRKIQANLEEMT